MKANSAIVFGLGALLLSCAMTCFRGEALADVTPVDAARTYLQTASDAYGRGLDICSGGCEDDLSAALGSLGTSLGPLRDAVSSGSIPAINTAVANTNTALQLVCNSLGINCSGPGGASNGSESGKVDLLGIGYDAPCFADSYYCQQGTIATHDTCINRVNEFQFCRNNMPFCDWRSAPFRPAVWDNCLQNSYYRAYLYQPGGRDCRCPVPPGYSERQGGCPDFFTQSDERGPVVPPQCLLGDGQGCGRCCYSKCVGADQRQSCRGSIRAECDVCEWSVRQELAAISMRATQCDAPFYRDIRVCYDQLQACIDACESTFCRCQPGCIEP
jgi:hypothetical protein